MLVFKSQTPQELLKEIAEHLRVRGLQMGIEAHPTFKTTKARRALAEARENALRLAAQELDDAGILPPKAPTVTEHKGRIPGPKNDPWDKVVGR